MQKPSIKYFLYWYVFILYCSLSSNYPLMWIVTEKWLILLICYNATDQEEGRLSKRLQQKSGPLFLSYIELQSGFPAIGGRWWWWSCHIVRCNIARLLKVSLTRFHCFCFCPAFTVPQPQSHSSWEVNLPHTVQDYSTTWSLLYFLQLGGHCYRQRKRDVTEHSLPHRLTMSSVWLGYWLFWHLTMTIIQQQQQHRDPSSAQYNISAECKTCFAI